MESYLRANKKEMPYTNRGPHDVDGSVAAEKEHEAQANNGLVARLLSVDCPGQVVTGLNFQAGQTLAGHLLIWA